MSETDDGVAARLRAELAEKPDGVLEALAGRHGVAMRVVLDVLGPEQAAVAPGGRFEAVWGELTTWGDVVLIVHTEDGVFEVAASLPAGTAGRGYFNIHGDSPLGGHLRADRCAAIYFVDRPFFGRRSCSVQFVSVSGAVMFKVFVRRDAERALDAAQLERFGALRAREVAVSGSVDPSIL